MTEKYRAIDIANYILWYAGENGNHGLTALKLQKILYYVVAAYLKKTGELLFSEKIEKWRYGPVTPSVYHTFKERGHGVLSAPTSQLKVVDGEEKIEEFDPAKIEVNHTEIINPVIDKLMHLSAFDLVEMTHKEDAWLKDEVTILTTWDNPPYEERELLKAVDSLADL